MSVPFGILKCTCKTTFAHENPQNGTATQPLRRIGREIHYPPGVVDVQDPFILLVHQGMVEDVFLDDLKIRGVEVVRSTPFSQYKETAAGVEIECDDLMSGKPKLFTSKYMVGCDGAHSKVRKSLLNATYDGERSNSAWGVLDGEYTSVCGVN